MEKFLEARNLPQLYHEELENVNRSTINKEIELLTKTFSTKKSSGPDGFIGKFYQTQKEELMLIFLKLFPKKWKRKKHFQTYSLWPALVCIKARQNTKRKDSFRPTPLMNVDTKILHKT